MHECELSFLIIYIDCDQVTFFFGGKWVVGAVSQQQNAATFFTCEFSDIIDYDAMFRISCELHNI